MMRSRCWLMKRKAIGFSAGAITALYLAAYYPEKITKVVALGGLLDSAGYKPSARKELRTLTAADCEKILPALVASRKKLMPEPARYGEMIDKLRDSWLAPVYVEKQKAAHIACPVLVVGGDRDEYIRLETFLQIYRLIPHAELAIVPSCGHVGRLENVPFFENSVIPFLLKKQAGQL